MQMDVLWKYMQVDMEADSFETEMRQSPSRQKLLKQRDFLLEQQDNMKRIEGEVSAMTDRLDAVRDEYLRLSDLLAKDKKALDEETPETKEELDKAIESMQRMVDNLSHYEQELQRIKKDSDTRLRQQREIRVQAAKTKMAYDALKKSYDVEFKESSRKLKDLRARTEKEAKGVDPELLERYKWIKQHSTPPMALLMENQCGGCYMQLPSVSLKELRAGEKVVECENCGRIVYVPEDML